LQGTAERQQLTDTQAHDGFPRWSPNGSRIAFISNREGGDNWEIYVMDADGSSQQRLTHSEGVDGIPTWSPDGARIAFESNRDGNKDIYVMDADAANVRRLTDSTASDMSPAWRPLPPTTGSVLPPVQAALIVCR
jgi:Tol biopolymer transport system component